MTEKNVLAYISKLKECSQYEDANIFLELGWILLNTHVVDHGYLTDQRTIYCLGWKKELGEPKYPKSKYADLET